MNKNQVAKSADAPLPAVQQVPDWMKDKGRGGIDKLTAADMEVPRIKLIQAISPELTEHNVLKPGDFWHTLGEQSLGKAMLIVPIYIDKRYILWKPRKAGGGILARADDGTHWNPANVDFQITLPETKKTVTWTTKDTVEESGLANWGSYNPEDPNSQPAATLMYTMVAAMPDYPDLGFAQLTLQRGSVKVAKSLIGKIMINPTVPSYGRLFRMSSFEEQSESGTFFNYRFAAEGFIQNQDQFNAYESLYKQFAKTGLNIKDLETMQDDEPATKPSKASKDY